MADTHNLTGSFHLCGQCTFCCDEFIKRQTRDLNDTVVQHRLETCVCFASDGVRDLIQCVAQCDLGCNLGDRITGSLTCKCGRTAYTRVNLDDTVLKALRMKGILYVTSTCNTKLCDDVKSRCTKHLILFITKGLGRSNYDGVTGMDTNRVNVLHVADCDAVSYAVSHYLILDLFPSGDTSLYKNLTYTGKTKTVFKDLTKLRLVVRDTAAASAKCVCRTENNRISDGLCKFHTIFYGCNDLGCCNRLADLFHGIFEFLTVLSFTDGCCCGTDKAYIVLFQEAFLLKLHGKVQSCLAAQCRKYTVRFLFEDQLLYDLNSQRLDVNSVCDVFICHDGSRIGV